MARLKIRPISLKESKEFCDKYHRHNVGSKAHKFSIGLEKDGELVGVAVVGRPIARKVDDGKTAEITRVCVNGDYKNANSMLYGAACRAAFAMGYDSVITYTLETESGSSLKSAGFQVDAHSKCNNNGWDSPSRRRTVAERYPMCEKTRWRRRAM